MDRTEEQTEEVLSTSDGERNNNAQQQQDQSLTEQLNQQQQPSELGTQATLNPSIQLIQLIDVQNLEPRSPSIQAASSPLCNNDIITGNNNNNDFSFEGEPLPSPIKPFIQKRKRPDRGSLPVSDTSGSSSSTENNNHTIKKMNLDDGPDNSPASIPKNPIPDATRVNANRDELNENNNFSISSNINNEHITGQQQIHPHTPLPTQHQDFLVVDDDDLEWVNPNSTTHYNLNSSPPFVVLIESTLRGRNLGKLDPVSVIDFLSRFIRGPKQINRSGINQIKVTCEIWSDANILANSKDLTREGFKAFIPDSFLRKRGFTDWFPASRSIKDIIRVSSVDELKNIAKMTRIFDSSNVILDRIEVSFNCLTIPRFITLGGFAIQITPVI